MSRGTSQSDRDNYTVADKLLTVDIQISNNYASSKCMSKSDMI